MRKMDTNLKKVALILILIYIIGLLLVLRPPPARQEEVKTQKVLPDDEMFIAEKLGFLKDGRIDQREEKIIKKILPLYNYRKSLFDDVNVTNPEKFANLCSEVYGTLQTIPLLLRDDMLRFLFAESPYTLEEFSRRVAMFNLKVREFMGFYSGLPSNIKYGIENSKEIYKVRDLDEYIYLVSELRNSLAGLPPEIIEAIDGMKNITDGFEPREINVFLRGLYTIREALMTNVTFDDWFIMNSEHFRITDIASTFSEFVKEQRTDRTPPAFKGDVRSLPNGTLQFEITATDNANPPRKIVITLNGERNEFYLHTEHLKEFRLIRVSRGWGEYNISIKVYDARGNAAGTAFRFLHYPEVFRISFNNSGYPFQRARLYTRQEIRFMWIKASEYKPLQVYQELYPDLGFTRYGKINLGSFMGFVYEDARRKFFTFYKKPLPFYSITPLHVVYFVNYYVHSYSTPIIGTLHSGICGYDAETQAVLMNRFFMDFNLNAWAVPVPASLRSKALNHIELVVLWRAPLLVGSNYRGVYLLGKDPYVTSNVSYYPFSPRWPRKYATATVEIMRLGLLPYRPEEWTMKHFYEKFNISVIPDYPLKNLMNEFISGYEFFSPYIAFRFDYAYVQHLLNMARKGDLRLLDEFNRLEAARALWYRIDGHNMYYITGYSPDYIVVDGKGRFYYHRMRRSKMFSSG
ncbi:hypothetical protein [Thermococcus sp.]